MVKICYFPCQWAILIALGIGFKKGQNQLYTKNDRLYIRFPAHDFCYLSWRYLKLGATK